MRYRRFRIKNFKGIKETTVDFGQGNTKVFAIVGLNESGKTTILEAIHSFSPDTATSELVGGTGRTGVPVKDRVPRHLLASFTGKVSVEATVSITQSDKEAIVSALKLEDKITLNESSLTEELIFERHQVFERGDLVNAYFSLHANLQIRTGKERKWRIPSEDESTRIRDTIYSFTPDIAYFPTFVFDFPKRVFLTNRGTRIDRFYKRTFQDILDFDGQMLSIKTDIIRRIRDTLFVVPWLDFLSTWPSSDEKNKIQQILDRAASVVTKVVFGRWNQIFGEDVRERR